MIREILTLACGYVAGRWLLGISNPMRDWESLRRAVWDVAAIFDAWERWRVMLLDASGITGWRLLGLRDAVRRGVVSEEITET